MVFTSHETCQWHLLAYLLACFASIRVRVQKAWGPHDQHFYQLAVLVHNSKVRMGEQNCHMP
jgi:hypothetical protein